MITELLTRRGFPHWLTRKDTGNGTVLTMDAISPVVVGDGFVFNSPPL